MTATVVIVAYYFLQSEHLAQHMHPIVKRNRDGSYSPISGTEILGERLAIFGASQVQDGTSGGLLFVYEVGDQLLIVDQATKAEVQILADELIASASRKA